MYSYVCTLTQSDYLLPDSSRKQQLSLRTISCLHAHRVYLASYLLSVEYVTQISASRLKTCDSFTYERITIITNSALLCVRQVVEF